MREAIEQYVSIWNSNDVSKLEHLFRKESTYWDSLQQGDAIGLLREAIANTHEAFSDILFEIISVSEVGGRQFFLHWRMTGLNTGPFYSQPPTGKRIDIEGLDSIQCTSGAIVDIKSFYDSSLFNQQLELQ